MSDSTQHTLQSMVDKVLYSPTYIDLVDINEIKWIKNENGGYRLYTENDIDIEL